MVCARNPECFISLHSLKTNEDILHRVIECVSHMQLTCNVWRRHNNCKWFLVTVYFSMEILLIQPFLIQSFLNFGRIVILL